MSSGPSTGELRTFWDSHCCSEALPSGVEYKTKLQKRFKQKFEVKIYCDISTFYQIIEPHPKRETFNLKYKIFDLLAPSKLIRGRRSVN